MLAVVAGGLCLRMYRRNESLLGMTALGLLLVAALLGVIYAAVTDE